MRTIGSGLLPRNSVARLIIGGEPHECRSGDSIAAVLTVAGRHTCRITRSGEPRGVFCGMGVCQECVVDVEGVPTRACMTSVRDGMRIELHREHTLASAVPAEFSQEILEPDVLVIGGGPGGLAAAAAAAEAGAGVVLVDERAKLGGQYFKQPSDAFDVDEHALDAQYRQGRELIRRVERAGVGVLAGVQVWGAEASDRLFALGDNASLLLQPRRLVLATGAYERGVPLPGWTLPGFMTTGAAQTLMRAYQVLPGRRVLVSGNGPLNVQVAAELVRAGATVVALCETAHVTSPTRAGAATRMAAAASDLLVAGVRYLRALQRAHVPVLFGWSVVRAEGSGRVERAVAARLDEAGFPVPGSERAFDIDAVCVGFGFLPSNEIARALGVDHVFDAGLGQLVAVRDPGGRTSIESVWIVGDGGGAGGARLARATGILAGIDVARSLGHDPPARLRSEGRAAERDRRRNERFQQALARVYAAPRLIDQLTEPDTLICRCEEVPLRAISEAFDAGVESIGAVKRVTRAGMGRCQGRYCAPVLAELASRRSGRSPEESAWFAPSPPFRPLPVGLAVAASEALRADASAETG